jgi:hypothetical protein
MSRAKKAPEWREDSDGAREQLVEDSEVASGNWLLAFLEQGNVIFAKRNSSRGAFSHKAFAVDQKRFAAEAEKGVAGFAFLVQFLGDFEARFSAFVCVQGVLFAFGTMVAGSRNRNRPYANGLLDFAPGLLTRKSSAAL